MVCDFFQVHNLKSTRCIEKAPALSMNSKNDAGTVFAAVKQVLAQFL